MNESHTHSEEYISTSPNESGCRKIILWLFIYRGEKDERRKEVICLPSLSMWEHGIEDQKK